jgi:hypothetical protein
VFGCKSVGRNPSVRIELQDALLDRCQRNPSAVAMQHLPAELAFQRARHLTDPRSGQAKPLGAASKVQQRLGPASGGPGVHEVQGYPKAGRHRTASARMTAFSLKGPVVNDLTIYTLARARLEEIHDDAAVARLANQIRRHRRSQGQACSDPRPPTAATGYCELGARPQGSPSRRRSSWLGRWPGRRTAV